MFEAKTTSLNPILHLLLIGCLAAITPMGDVRAQAAPGDPCNGIPYNPDFDCDGLINTSDLLQFLPYLGFDFVAEIDSLGLDLEYVGDSLFLMNENGELIDAVELGFADGLGAYELWIELGNQGTEEDFLDSLVGAEGEPGQDGAQGEPGQNGAQGEPGQDGAQGEPGQDGAQGEPGQDGAQGEPGQDGAQGEPGQDGAQGEPGQDGAQGEPGQDGAQGVPGQDGVSAYETWLSLDNTGTEEDFIAALTSNAAFSPSTHGIFDSESNGTTFVIDHAISTLSIELWGATGGDGGDICGSMPGETDCSLCNAQGGLGGQALKMVSMVYNLANGDTLELVQSAAGDSGDLVACEVGTTGWVNWDCGPAPNGTNAGATQLLLNGTPIAVISGGTAGTGACIGCQGDGCFEGTPGMSGALETNAPWMTVISTSALETATGSRLILRY
jgi:hypothetical protein